MAALDGYLCNHRLCQFCGTQEWGGRRIQHVQNESHGPKHFTSTINRKSHSQHTCSFNIEQLYICRHSKTHLLNLKNDWTAAVFKKSSSLATSTEWLKAFASKSNHVIANLGFPEQSHIHFIRHPVLYLWAAFRSSGPS